MDRLILLALIFFGFTSAFAVRVNSIYQAEVPVSSQAAEERDKAFQEGFLQVLMKVSGKTNLTDDPKIKSHLSEAPSMIQEYSYSDSDPIHNQTPYVLKMRYDTAGVNRILRDAKLPMWGTDRPLILGWIEYEEPNKPAELIDSSSNNYILGFIKRRADLRAIPFMLPIMDVTDINKVALNDIISMNIPVMQSAAKRYMSDGVLVIRIISQPKGFSAQAKLALGSNTWNFNFSGTNLEEILNNLIDSATTALSGKYSTLLTKTVHAPVVVKIKGVSEQEDFSNLMQYMQRITAVASAQPILINGDEVELSINLRGSRDALTQAITLDKKLTLVPTESSESTLVYQWNR